MNHVFVATDGADAGANSAAGLPAEFMAACHRVAQIIHQHRVDGRPINQGSWVFHFSGSGSLHVFKLAVLFWRPVFVRTSWSTPRVSAWTSYDRWRGLCHTYVTVTVPQQFCVWVCVTLRQQCQHGVDENEGLPPDDRVHALLCWKDAASVPTLAACIPGPPMRLVMSESNGNGNEESQWCRRQFLSIIIDSWFKKIHRSDSSSIQNRTDQSFCRNSRTAWRLAISHVYLLWVSGLLTQAICHQTSDPGW